MSCKPNFKRKDKCVIKVVLKVLIGRVSLAIGLIPPNSYSLKSIKTITL